MLILFSPTWALDPGLEQKGETEPVSERALGLQRRAFLCCLPLGALSGVQLKDPPVLVGHPHRGSIGRDLEGTELGLVIPMHLLGMRRGAGFASPGPVIPQTAAPQFLFLVRKGTYQELGTLEVQLAHLPVVGTRKEPSRKSRAHEPGEVNGSIR